MSVYCKKRKDGTTAWYYYFCYQGKRYRAVGGATKTQALRAQEKVRSQVLNGEYELENLIEDVEIGKFSETYLLRRQHLKSKKRDALSVRTLLKYFAGRMLGAIGPSDIEDYIASRKTQGVSNGTINRELAALKRMYNLAIRWKQAKRNPVNEVEFLKEPPGRTRFLSTDEAKTLLDCCSSALYPIVFTALNTGMRLTEILTLTWERVHVDAVMSPFIELTQTKNNKIRAIPLNDEMVELLQDLKGRDRRFVFIGERGKPLKSVKKPFETALRNAGIVNFHFHDLRHTFASHFVMQGGDLLTLKEILGHSSMKMVERYAHLAQAHKRKQVQNLHGLFSERHLNATSRNVVNLDAGVSGVSD